MYIFRSIHEIIQTVNAARGLLTEMFEKRKSVNFKYSEALALLKEDENRLKLLIEKEVIHQNDNEVVLDARFQDFFELLLEANEEINTAVIDEYIEYLHELMDYYLKEQVVSRKNSYVRNIKATFRKMARTMIRNIMNLQTSIDSAFKHEPTYQIKIAKLENLDKKRMNIQRLIDSTENLILNEERLFFQQAADEELNRILLSLRSDLQLSAHSLIRAQEDIINYLNQIKSQVVLVEKIRRVKLLMDQFELRTKSNLSEVMENEHAILIEGTAPASFKLSIPYLNTDEVRPVLLKIRRSQEYRAIVRSNEAGAFSEEEMAAETRYEETIRLRDALDSYLQLQAQRQWNDANAEPEDLFTFLMHHTFNREVSETERTTLFCQLVSLYETDLRISDAFGIYKNYEYVKIYPA